MNIRQATEIDTREIVSVLKASLGEEHLALSEEIWRYKHILNPFGKSLVLIAEEDNKIVGVRAFMRWHFYNKEKRLTCYRAVDTATHPEFQGRGIFKKLTLKALDIVQEDEGSFVFNTPNEKSRPGYLKMGWEVAGKLKVSISPALNSFWKINKSVPEYQINYQTSRANIEDLCNLWNINLNTKNLYTRKSLTYLNWRYEKNPLRNYEVLAFENFYLAGYIQNHKKIKELRIVECIFVNDSATKDICKHLYNWSSKFGAQVISWSPNIKGFKNSSITGKFGPILTVRNLNLSNKETENLFSIENWCYSLGDLELF